MLIHIVVTPQPKSAFLGHIPIPEVFSSRPLGSFTEKVVFVRGEAATGKKKKRGFVCRLDLAFRHKLMGFPKKGFKEVLSPEEGARS